MQDMTGENCWWERQQEAWPADWWVPGWHVPYQRISAAYTSPCYLEILRFKLWLKVTGVKGEQPAGWTVASPEGKTWNFMVLVILYELILIILLIYLVFSLLMKMFNCSKKSADGKKWLLWV